MATITNTVRWADNTAELKKNLMEGIGTVDAMKQSVDRVIQSMSGQGLFKAANQVTAALIDMGGATKLTAAEQDRANAILERAIEKYKVMGMTAPPAMLEMAAATKKQTSAWQEFTGSFNVEDAISNPIGTAKNALSALASTMGTTAVAALTMATAVVAVGTAVFKLAIDAAKVGAELDDMADKTGLSVPALSKLQNAAAVAGTSLQAMTDIIFKLERGLAAGGKEFEEGLQKIGTSTAELKAAGPDHYLELVAQGLKNLEDPTERAAAGTAILGKGYKDVAASLNDLADAMELTADIEPWTKEEASAAEAFDMKLASMVVHAKALATAIGRDLIGPISTFVGIVKDAVLWVNSWIDLSGGIVGMFRTIADWARTASAAWDIFTGKIEKTPEITGSAKRGVDQVKDSIKGMAATAPSLEQAFANAALAEIDLNAQVKDSIELHKKQQDTSNKLGEETKKTTAKVRELEAGFFGLRTSVGQADDRELKFMQTSIGLRAELDKVENTAHIANFGFKGMADSLENVGTKVRDLGPDIQHQFVGPIQEATTATKGFWQTLVSFEKKDFSFANLGAGLKNSLGGLSNIFQSAFEGGGGVKGAVKSFATDAVATVTSMIPVVGGVISQFAGPIVAGVTKLFGGVSAAEKQARADVQQFEAQLASTLTTTQKTEAAGRSWAMTTIAIRDAYLAAGHTAAEAEQVTLRLWDTKNPQAYKGAIEEINAVMKEQSDDQARAKELIDEYGIAIDQLGPKWRAQQLNDQAKTLMNDFRLMVDVLGVDAPQAMELMAGKMSQFVQDSVKASTEIPANMQPMLQQMADMGLLTDENGNKITDLKDYGVTFAETFGQGVDRIVAKFDELIARLGGAADGINDIPDQKNIDVNYNVHWNVPPMPQPNEAITYGATGGVVGNHGVQYFPTGGVVLPFAPRGTDTVPAMLTPGEGVLSRNDMMALGGPGGFRAFRRMLHMGGGGNNGEAILSSLLASQERTSRYMQVDFKNDLARAVRDELQKARVA